jgi:hypothetical protein
MATFRASRPKFSYSSRTEELRRVARGRVMTTSEASSVAESWQTFSQQEFPAWNAFPSARLYCTDARGPTRGRFHQSLYRLHLARVQDRRRCSFQDGCGTSIGPNTFAMDPGILGLDRHRSLGSHCVRIESKGDVSEWTLDTRGAT